jgi:hypothetical protein
MAKVHFSGCHVLFFIYQFSEKKYTELQLEDTKIKIKENNM